MNPLLHPLDPLPTALRQPNPYGLARRKRIGEYKIDPDALRHFNELLQRLPLQRAPLGCDQLASAARELVDNSRPGQAPACIKQRMRRAAAIDLMVYDPDWDTVDEAAIHATVMVVVYVRGSGVVFPKGMPVVGHLDHAILIDAAWPSLALEIGDYLGFRRIRHVEAGLAGEPRRHFSFARKHWQPAAQAETAWIAHCVRVGHDSYQSNDAPSRFRVS